MDKNFIRGQFMIQTIRQQQSIQTRPYGHTMPAKPTEKYDLLQKSDQSISKQVQKCPFPILRNLTIVYLKEVNLQEQYLPQILAHQYQQRPQLKEIDKNISKQLIKANHSAIKLQNLKKCIQKCRAYYDKTTQKFRHSMLDEKNLANQLQRQLKKINEEFQGDRSRRNDPEERSKKNKQIVELFKSHYTQFNNKNIQFLKRQNIYKQITIFKQFLQKAIPVIMQSEHVSISDQVHIKDNILAYFDNTINDILNELILLIKELTSQEYKFRSNVKSSHEYDQTQQRNKECQQKMIDLSHRIQENNQKAKRSLYGQIKGLQICLNQMVKSSEKQLNSLKKDYKQFLTKFTDIKQVINCEKKFKDIEETIELQEKSLIHHLNLNYGLIVPFKKSQQYQRVLQPLQRRDYLKGIFQFKIAPLQKVIAYMNVEYRQIYEKACDGRVSKRQVAYKKQEFQQLRKKRDPQNELAYFTHIFESLARLMALCKQ